jgi:arginase
MNSFAILEAPSILGLQPTGVEGLSRTLLELGLADHLPNAHLAGRVDPETRYSLELDPEIGVLNADGIARFSRLLADRVGELLEGGAIPLVLGGDCSILLGNLLALRRRGRYGLLFLDGHNDCYVPGAYKSGQAAAMDLGLATGSGPDCLANLDDLRPLVRSEDVVLLGPRDQQTGLSRGRGETPAAALEIGLEEIRRDGIEIACDQAMARLASAPLEGFWLHLDVDVIADELMPAVDYRIPGGLTWEELEVVLHRASASGRLAGLNVTIYNPALDSDLAAGRALERSLVAGLS